MSWVPIGLNFGRSSCTFFLLYKRCKRASVTIVLFVLLGIDGSSGLSGYGKAYPKPSQEYSYPSAKKNPNRATSVWDASSLHDSSPRRRFRGPRESQVREFATIVRSSQQQQSAAPAARPASHLIAAALPRGWRSFLRHRSRRPAFPPC
jgi:hypothetical protein